MRVLSTGREISGYFAAIALLFCLFTSCVQPIEYNAANTAFTRQTAEHKAWKTVAVLPFTGDLAYRRVAGEWFAFQLGKSALFALITPGFSETELSRHDIHTTEADMPLEGAVEAGRILGADAVIVGSVKSKEWHGPVSGVSLIDVASGKVVATSIHSEPNIFVNSGKKRMILAAGQNAADILAILLQIAGKPRPTPNKEQPSRPDELKMPWSN